MPAPPVSNSTARPGARGASSPTSGNCFAVIASIWSRSSMRGREVRPTGLDPRANGVQPGERTPSAARVEKRMTSSKLFPVLGAAALLGLVPACGGDKGEDKQAAAATPRPWPAIADTPVKTRGGTFAMGEDDVYAEEGPVRETTVAGFWIDPHEVTNRQFAAFVQATGSDRKR